MKKWIIRQPDPDRVQTLVKKTDLSQLCAEVLVSGGIDDLSKAQAFFEEEELSSPFLLKDMARAVEIINAAVEEEKQICIYGDYDCDGVTATVMLYLYLESIGGIVHYYIPEREEGYGMNKEAVRKLAQEGIQLIITVDNGISAAEEAELIKELGMELVITDHHQPPEPLPKALAVVNPHRRDCPSPFKELCGAGVVLKLIAAMDGGDYDAVLEQFSDLAALATIADVVGLTGENRTLVKHGLHLLANTENLGLMALMEESRIDPHKLSSTAAAFMLAPRINAAGRFGSPSLAVRLLLTDDEEEAVRLASELSRLNNERKKTEGEILQAIEDDIAAHPEKLNRRVLIFSGENWHHGVIGIVSARVLEKYGKPNFILTIEGERTRGSARSLPECSVFEALQSCSDLLERFGGHAAAGGLTLSTPNIEAFSDRLAEHFKERYPSMPRLTLTAQKLLEPRDLTVDSVQSLNALEPFGEANPRPVFAVLGARVEGIQALSEGRHIKLKLNYHGIFIPALLFGTSPSGFYLRPGDTGDFLLYTELNHFNGKTTVSARVVDYRISGLSQPKYFAALEAYERYRLGEGVPQTLKARMVPDREELGEVYKALSQEALPVDILFARLSSDRMNYCKLRICLDVFEELGLIHRDPVSDTAVRLPVTKKVDLGGSAILSGLRCL